MERKIELLDYLIRKGKLISKGAESNLYLVDYLGFKCILKYRVKKRYRIKELDEKIRRRRTIREVSILQELYKEDIPVPSVIYANINQSYFLMEYLSGESLKNIIVNRVYNKEKIIEISRKLGEIIANIHNRNISHGDLTTANLIVRESFSELELYILDFGLSEKNIGVEEKAIDIDIFYRVLEAAHTEIKDLIFDNFLGEYKKYVNNYKDILSRYIKIRKMGRYIEERRKKNR